MEFGHKTRPWLLGRSQLFTVKGTVSVDMGFEAVRGPQTFVLRGLKSPQEVGVGGLGAFTRSTPCYYHVPPDPGSLC